SWYVLGVWDQENSDLLSISARNAADKDRYGSLALASDSPRTAAAFVELARETARRITQPARVDILSRAAAPQSAPPDTLQPARTKTYAEAVDLLKQSAERTATKWEPIVSRTGAAAITRDQGLGFFTEGDNRTG